MKVRIIKDGLSNACDCGTAYVKEYDKTYYEDIYTNDFYRKSDCEVINETVYEGLVHEHLQSEEYFISGKYIGDILAPFEHKKVRITIEELGE